MSDWTLCLVKDNNMEINAFCEAEGCRHFFTFDLDALIAAVGPKYAVDNISSIDCPQCGASPLVIRLSFVEPQSKAEEG